ncbi:cuticle protein AM/CP1114-like [Palaemon carinicauda]|uniref:cuticle protein AM/CP1114-like n=1 Tax=Palaemon carinicauda TaxID=392227 RepID=UPI0035B5B589
MKAIFASSLAFAALFATCVSGAPQQPTPRPIAIIRDDRFQPQDGAYSFDLETENGIIQSEAGSPGSQGQTNVQGSFRFPLDDGSFAEVTYIADENGFQVQSPLLPVAPAFPHPIPDFVLKQIAFAEEQRRLEAAGGRA